MRFALTVVLWLATTVALAVAVPAGWAQLNVVDEDGYAAFARKAAGDPDLQSAAAAELSTRAMALIETNGAHGAGKHPVESAEVHEIASAFTAGPSFPPLFADANRAAHRYLFSEANSGDAWVIDVAPMLKDSAFAQVLSSHNAKVPATLTVPLTVSLPGQSVHQGQLSRVAAWGPWVSLGAAVLSGFFGLLTLAAARRRGKALTSLGVSALLVGAAGWVGIEVGGRYLGGALNGTTGDIRQVADVMIRHAEAGMHFWLNLTLIAGVVLTGFGVLLAIGGSILKSKRSG
jgi:hypothetical protein